MTRISYLIGLSILLIISSCHSNRKRKTSRESDAHDRTVKAETAKEPVPNQIDTLTIEDRQFVDGNYHSHIGLDFAQSTTETDDTSQVRLIDKTCAVSVIPDTSWMNQQEKEMGDDWNEVVSDHQYYDYLARDTLEKLNIPTFFAPREKRFIRFVKADKSEFTIDVTKMKDAWGLILFNGNDNPVLWSSTDMDGELKEIYHK